MMFSKLDCVKFRSNLYSIGVDNATMQFSLMRKWLKYRKSLLSLVSGRKNALQDIYDKFLDAGEQRFDKNEQFFISFHYGYYPLLLEQITRLGTFKKVNFLIHEHNNDVSGLKKVCRLFGCNADFVCVDEKGRFVRKLLKAKKQGEAIFMLVDLPVGGTPATLSTCSMFDGGKFQHMNGFLRIASLLSLHPTLIYHAPAAGQSKLALHKQQIERSDEVFSVFEDLVKASPEYWERIHDLHLFFQPASSARMSGVTFRSHEPDEFFLYSSNGARMFKISEGVFRAIKAQDSKHESLVDTLRDKFKVAHVS